MQIHIIFNNKYKKFWIQNHDYTYKSERKKINQEILITKYKDLYKYFNL